MTILFTGENKMSDMKCPICGGELKHEPITGIYCCKRIFTDCPLGSGTGAFGTKELWQELIRTRKALDIIAKEFYKETMPDFAVISDALKGVSDE